jgi:hypothetical protein
MKIQIIRDFQDKNQTLGTCTVYDDSNKPIFTAVSLERGWRDNASNVSCVPLGQYPCVLEYSPRFKKDLWELKNVPNRSECKFHSANYWFQLNGCIALGSSLADINKDGYNDVANSGNTMKKFHEALKGLTKVDLVIKQKNCTCNK